MSAPSVPVGSVAAGLPPQLRAALRLLLRASDYAERCERNPWDFAVEIADLRAAGLTTADLRLLSCQGQVEHAVERTKPGANQRLFSTRGGLLFSERTCFVLTGAGAGVARVLEREAVLPVAEMPFYDRDLRELLFYGLLVKAFRQPAPDQDPILRSFEEEHWTRRIDSPLSPHNFEEDPKLRLRRAIRRLNQHQIHRLINFLADGSGEGIRWEPWDGEVPERRR